MQKLHTEDRRQRRWVYPNITPSLVGQVDHAVQALQTHGAPKYSSRRQFIEKAIAGQLEKEGIVGA